jgi:hypothetical protein
MQFPSVPASNKEARSPDLGDLCEAMFIEGSRTLGFDFTDEIPPAAQGQIMKAAAQLAERLGNMISIQASAGNSSELGN